VGIDFSEIIEHSNDPLPDPIIMKYGELTERHHGKNAFVFARPKPNRLSYGECYSGVLHFDDEMRVLVLKTENGEIHGFDSKWLVVILN